jgi:sulfate adenylyltransferase subunit 1 (EFTu-like GTPase family)
MNKVKELIAADNKKDAKKYVEEVFKVQTQVYVHFTSNLELYSQKKKPSS